MRTAFSNLKVSLDHVRDIANDLQQRLLQPGQNIQTRSSTQTISCGTVVIMSGYFESFLADIAKAFIINLCNAQIPFNSLPVKIQTTHFTDGSRFLHDITRNRLRWHTSTKEDVLRRLNTVLTVTPYELLWEAFADTNSNPGVQTVEEILKKCGLSDVWVLLKSKSNVEPEVQKLKLEAFVSLRNECAHTGTATTIPSPQKILETCDDLELLSNAMVEILNDHLLTLSTPVAMPIVHPTSTT